VCVREREREREKRYLDVEGRRRFVKRPYDRCGIGGGGEGRRGRERTIWVPCMRHLSRDRQRERERDRQTEREREREREMGACV